MNESLKMTFDDDAAPEEPVVEAPEQEAPEEPIPEPEAEAEPEVEPEGEPESEAEEDEVVAGFNEEQQRIFNEAMNKKTAKFYQLKQEKENRERELEQQLEALQAKIPQDERPVIPDMPDVDDDDFADKVKARDKVIEEAARWDENEKQQSSIKLQQAQQKQQDRVETLQKTIATYTERANTLGIKPEQLTLAGNMVNAAGIDDSLVEHILADPLGPQITVYLSKNLAELDTINSMTPTQAAVYIENQVKPKAAGSRKKVTPPPEPSKPLRGKGAPESEDGLAGVSYE